MQKTSQLYQEILEGHYNKEVRLAIGISGRLITRQGDSITFGGYSILIGTSGADGGYGENSLVSMQTSTQLFSKNTVTVGSCVSGEIDVCMLQPLGTVTRNARLVPYIRITDGKRYSEWIQKGVYYIDTRDVSEDASGIKYLSIHGYDSMLKAEQPYPSSTLQWPATDVAVVREIAKCLDVPIDSRTISLMNKAYNVQYPGEYTCREVLGFIAAMYGGCFVMSDIGELRLVQFFNIPKETRYLVVSGGDALTFGGDRILV